MQRRWICVVCALMLVSIAGANAQGTPPEPQVAPPGYSPRGLGTTYLALGDSLTTGSEAALNNDGLPGYPDVLYGYLRPLSPTLAYKNLGKDGETSTSMITATGTITRSQLDLAVDFIRAERAAGRRVGLVTLDIGGNDFINILFNLAASPELVLTNYRKNLTTIVDRLLAALTDGSGARDGDLVLMDYYNPYPDLIQKFPFVPSPDVYVPRINAIIKEVAAARGLPVAEVFAPFAGREAQLIYVQRDSSGAYYDLGDPNDPVTQSRFDYHPRPLGHQQIAAAFLNVSGYKQRVWLPLVVKDAPTATPAQ